MPGSGTNFLIVRAYVSLKVATKGSFRFLGYFSKEKNEEVQLKRSAID